MIRIGIIGAGYGAAVHLPAFLDIPGVVVAALADGGSGAAKRLAPPGCQALSDWRRLLDTPGLNAVVVATPPRDHQEITLAALSRQLDVLCEKPMGMSYAQATAMAQGVRQYRQQGWVGFQFRYEAGLSRLASLVRTGEIGDVTLISFQWLTAGRANPARPWSWQNDKSQGGGVINAFMPHVIDLIHFIAGQTITGASSEAKILIDRRPDQDGIPRTVTAEDWVSAEFTFDSRLTAKTTVSNCLPNGTGMKIDVEGQLGHLCYHHRPPFTPADMSLTLTKSGQHPVPIDLAFTRQSNSDSRVVATSRLAHAVISDMTEKTTQAPSFADGLRVRRILDILQ